MLLADFLDDQIVIRGYSRRYKRAVEHVLDVEGGYVNDPVDPGGATNKGISLRFLVAAGDVDMDGDGFADFDLDMDGDIDADDIRRLTKGDAVHLYWIHFWLAAECESFAKPIGEMVFDQAVNGGLVAARRLLQRAINRSGLVGAVATDAQIGPKTRAALARIESIEGGVFALTHAYREETKARYYALVRRNPKLKRFIKGWIARAEQLGRWA